MKGLFTLGLSTAFSVWPQSAQQHSRHSIDGQRIQCSALHESSEMIHASLLQVQRNADNDKRRLPFNRFALDGPYNVKTRKRPVWVEPNRKTNGLDARDDQLRPLTRKSLSWSSIATNTSYASRPLLSIKRKAGGSVALGRHDVQIVSAFVGEGDIVPVKNTTATASRMASAQTFTAKKGSSILWKTIIMVLLISIIAFIVGYALVGEDREAKWRSASGSRGISVKKSELLTESDKHSIRRELARQRGADFRGAEPQSYPSQFAAAPSEITSARYESRKRLPNPENAPPEHPGVRSGNMATLVDRPSVDQTMGYDDTLSPGLVVPLENDCVLAIRAITQIAAKTTSIIDILDLQGQSVLEAHISGCQSPRTNNSPRASEFPAITLRTSSSAQGEILAICRKGDVSHGRPSMYIYNARDELFGILIQDNKRSRRWVFMGVSGGPKIFFDGSSFDRSIVIKDACDEQVAKTEPCTFEFDVEGNCYQLSVASGTDVGLILCGVLSIEWLETSTMQP